MPYLIIEAPCHAHDLRTRSLSYTVSSLVVEACLTRSFPFVANSFALGGSAFCEKFAMISSVRSFHAVREIICQSLSAMQLCAALAKVLDILSE